MKFSKRAFGEFHKFYYETTTRIRFCLSHDRFKLDFIVFKVDIISIENTTLSRTSLWRYMYAPKCYVTCGITIFMTWRYPLNNSDVIWQILKWFKNEYEPSHDKTNNLAVRPAKTQISLGIRPVWSESSLSAERKVGSIATHWTHSEGSDQTGRIWVFVGRIATLLVL